jgi:hypothetical protein
MDHVTTMCLRIGNFKPKCGKCGLPHRIENRGIGCGYCTRMGLSKIKMLIKGKICQSTIYNQ